MILLDTNAIIWMDVGHARARPLARGGQRLYVSPASLLELQFLHEAGRIRLRGRTPQWLLDDERWVVDEPPSVAWFQRAADFSWTRDPFDRLIAAHAHTRKWRVATADARMIEQLGPARCVEL